MVAGLLAGIVGVIYFVARTPTSDKQSAAGLRIMDAMAKYVVALRAQSKPVPEVINLRELIDGGYIARDQTGVFSNLDLSISTKADDSHPQMFLAWAKLPDGTWNVCLADGSVQQFSAAAMAAGRQQQTNYGVESK